jgi:tetratricopeptide (TPR) repeat protein
VTASFISIGVVYEKKGDLEDALFQHQKALEIQTRVFGSDHLDVAKSYNNIGTVYNRQGKYEEALEYYQKDLDITVRLVGGDDQPDSNV